MVSDVCADPTKIAKNDNVFGLLPVDKGLEVAVWLMVIHQVIFPLPKDCLCIYVVLPGVLIYETCGLAMGRQ